MDGRKILTVLTLSGALLLIGACAPVDSTSDQSVEAPKPTYDADGRMIRPEADNYRRWVYVGTPLTPNSLNPPEAPFPEFHSVYIHPGDYDHYQATGTFRDGTVLIKELALVGSTSAVSGKGYFMGEFTGLEATVKDAARFPDEPGNWAYFTFGHTYPLADAAAAFPTAACNTCHENAAKDDFVFTQYYPVLQAARAGAQAGSGAMMEAGDEHFDGMEAAMTEAMDASLEATAETGSSNSEVPTEQTALHGYLSGGSYTELGVAETASHASRGPHTKVGLPVRVFMNDAMEASLSAGNAEHPAGASAVKEMFDADGELEGWAVMVKTQAESDGGQGWFWYETTSTEDASSVVGIGNGVPLCYGCHSIGKDFVLTGFPLQ